MSKDFHCPECGCLIDGDLMSADAMRRFFFAKLRDTFDNLPSHHRQRFPTSEALRKQALIAVGWCDVATVAAGSKSAAPGLKAIMEQLNRYALVVINGSVLTVYTARSMSRRSLLKKQFHEVSEQVFDWIKLQTGIDPAMSEAA